MFSKRKAKSFVFSFLVNTVRQPRNVPKNQPRKYKMGDISKGVANTLHTVKKSLAMFPSQAGMSLTKLSLAGNN
jgi:hypothetical protein